MLGDQRPCRGSRQAHSTQDLSNTAWAYATLAHAAPALLDAIAAAAAQRSAN